MASVLPLDMGTVPRTYDVGPAQSVTAAPAFAGRTQGGCAMLEPMLSDTMPFQGPMSLTDTLFCLDCEVLFTSLENCPSCAGSAIWPVAAWLSPSPPHLSIVST